MKRKLWSLILLVTLVVAGAAWVLRTGGVAASPPSPWRLPEARLYDLSWKQQQTTLAVTPGAAPQPLSSRSTVEAQLRISPASCAQPCVELGVLGLQRFEATVMGQPLPPEGLEGARALALLGEDGGLQQLRFEDASAPLARYFLQALAAELFPRLPADETLTWTEALPAGDAHTTVTWQHGHRDQLVRVREAFTQLRLLIGGTPPHVQSHATFRFSEEGGLDSLHASEELTAALAQDGTPALSTTSVLTLQLRERTASPAVALSPSVATVVRTPGAITPETDLNRSLLESIAGALTVEEMLQQLTVEHPGSIPDRKVFLRAATALLRLHPERAGELAALYASARSDAMRAQLVDLLVSAGTDQAQGTLRDILASPEARANRGTWEQLYPRLGLVERPSRESVHAVLTDHTGALTSGDESARTVTAFTLGSMAGALRERDPALAELAGDVLLDDVHLAETANRRARALRALGNSGDPRAVDAARAPFSDPDPEVRAAAATALRKVHTAGATALLLEQLGTEASGPGQAALFDALAGRSLTPDQLGHVRSLLVERRLSPGAERRLLDLLAAERTASPELLQSLQALITNPGVAPANRVRARDLLARLSR